VPPARTSPKLVRILRSLRSQLDGVSDDLAAQIGAVSQRAVDELEQQLKGLVPGRYTTTEVIGRLVQVRAIQRVVAGQLGTGMGNVLTKSGRVSSKVARANLVQQLTETERLYGLRPIKLPEATGVLAPGLLEHYQTSRLRYGSDALQQMRLAMSQSILQGETLAQTWERMADRVAIPSWRAERIARTETSLAGHRAELETMRQLAADGDPFRKRLVTLRDDRTGADSIKVDGQERDLDEPFHSPDLGVDFLHPPDRPNDRGTMIFVPVDIPPPAMEPEPKPEPEPEPEPAPPTPPPDDVDAHTLKQRNKIMAQANKQRSKATKAATVGQDGQAWDFRRQGDGGTLDPDASVVWCDPAKLDKLWKADRVGPGGEDGIGDRYQEFGWFLDNANMPIRPSEVSLAPDGSLQFDNGRHRFAVFRDRGASPVPVMVPWDQAQKLREQAGVPLAEFKTDRAKRAQQALAKMAGKGGSLTAGQQKEVRDFARTLVDLPQRKGDQFSGRNRLAVQRGRSAVASMGWDGKMYMQRQRAHLASDTLRALQDPERTTSLTGRPSTVEALKTFIHEEVHDRGPLVGYSHPLVRLLEEAVTENEARHTIWDRVLAPAWDAKALTKGRLAVERRKWLGPDAGSYGSYREVLRDALEEAAQSVGALLPFGSRRLDTLVDLERAAGRAMKGRTDDTSHGRHDPIHRAGLGLRSRLDARRHWFAKGSDEAKELVDRLAHGAFPDNAKARKVFTERINAHGLVRDMTRKAQRDL